MCTSNFYYIIYICHKYLYNLILIKVIYEYMQKLSGITYMMVQFEKELKTVNTADPKSKETLEHVRDTMLTYYIQAKTAMENIPHIKIEPIEEK